MILSYDAQTDSFGVVVPDLPACASQGDTREEALRNIREAIQLYLEPGEIKAGKGEEVVIVEVQLS